MQAEVRKEKMMDGKMPARYRRKEAAQYVGLSESTMDKLRCSGEGPIFSPYGQKTHPALRYLKNSSFSMGTNL